MARHPVVTNMPTETPTCTQLGVSNWKMGIRGCTLRCPACGARKTHTSFKTMADRCHQCSLQFERIAGHSLGYIGLNTTASFGATFIVILGGALLMHPDINAAQLLIAGLATGTLTSTLFLPISHTLWTAIDLILRPLAPGEIDPRFIKVDPEAGDWAAKK